MEDQERNQDVEGHKHKKAGLDEGPAGSGTDTEGHAKATKTSRPEKEDQDVEGHKKTRYV